jgi:hypothetical protein
MEVVRASRPTSPVIRSLTYATIGGLILLAVAAAYNIRDLRAPGLIPYLASAFAGGVVGWIYDLGTRMSRITSESIRTMTELSQLLEFQQPPLQMLVRAKRHASAVGILLQESIGEQYNVIALADPNKYLSFLRQALNNCASFSTVQRNTVSWFRDNTDGGNYLRDLSERRMREKIRIFIIDNDHEQRMRDELADSELMKFYWQRTGEIQTYWITTSDFRSNYPEFGTPDDFVLFDELLIKYDAQRLTVFFDIINDQSVEPRIFDRVRLQIQNGSGRPFIAIPNPGRSSISQVSTKP